MITARLTLSGGSALTVGTFGSATSSFDAATGVWSVSGSVADVNAAFAAVAYQPPADLAGTVTIAPTWRTRPAQARPMA